MSMRKHRNNKKYRFEARLNTQTHFPFNKKKKKKLKTLKNKMPGNVWLRPPTRATGNRANWVSKCKCTLLWCPPDLKTLVDLRLEKIPAKSSKCIETENYAQKFIIFRLQIPSCFSNALHYHASLSPYNREWNLN